MAFSSLADSKGIPETEAAWVKAVKANDLRDVTIHEVKIDSASKIKYEQYLPLRVLWRHHYAELIEVKQPDLKTWIKRATRELSGYCSWNRYCQNFVPPDKLFEGTFSPVTYYQAQTAKIKNDSVTPNVILHTHRSQHPQQGARKEEEGAGVADRKGNGGFISSDAGRRNPDEVDRRSCRALFPRFRCGRCGRWGRI